MVLLSLHSNNNIDAGFSAEISKVEKILKDSLDSIPSPSVKIQIMAGKVCLKCKGKTLLGIVNILLKKMDFDENFNT